MLTKVRSRKDKGEVVSAKTPPKAEDPPMCILCQEEFDYFVDPDDLQAPIALPCDKELDHLLHRECANFWFNKKGAINKLCPVCHVDPLNTMRSQTAMEIVRKEMADKRAHPVISEVKKKMSAARRRWTLFSRAATPYMKLLAGLAAVLLVFGAFSLLLVYSADRKVTKPVFVRDPGVAQTLKVHAYSDPLDARAEL